MSIEILLLVTTFHTSLNKQKIAKSDKYLCIYEILSYL